MEKFELEKMAIEYCVQYGIDDNDPRRGDVICAFCVGAKLEREACANICDNERSEFMAKAGENNGRESDFAFGSVNSAERIAAAIRMRSNV